MELPNGLILLPVVVIVVLAICRAYVRRPNGPTGPPERSSPHRAATLWALAGVVVGGTVLALGAVVLSLDDDGGPTGPVPARDEQLRRAHVALLREAEPNLAEVLKAVPAEARYLDLYRGCRAVSDSGDVWVEGPTLVGSWTLRRDERGSVPERAVALLQERGWSVDRDEQDLGIVDIRKEVPGGSVSGQVISMSMDPELLVLASADLPNPCPEGLPE